MILTAHVASAYSYVAGGKGHASVVNTEMLVGSSLTSMPYPRVFGREFYRQFEEIKCSSMGVVHISISSLKGLAITKNWGSHTPLPVSHMGTSYEFGVVSPFSINSLE